MFVADKKEPVEGQMNDAGREGTISGTTSLCR